MENEKLKMNIQSLIENDKIKQENIDNLKKDVEKLKKLFKIMILLK